MADVGEMVKGKNGVEVRVEEEGRSESFVNPLENVPPKVIIAPL